MPKRKRKKYSRPQRPFDKARIQEENALREKYGLKNKKEIWKADAAIRRIRNLAKKLITKSEEEKKQFIDRLEEKGFEVKNIADVLSLNKEDWLKRRLQTIVFAKKLALTPKQARQFITHKQVSIGNQIVNIPSYQVGLKEESLVKVNIALKLQPKKTSKKKEKVEEKVPVGISSDTLNGTREGKEKKVEEKEEKVIEKAEKQIDKEVSEGVDKKQLTQDIKEKVEEVKEKIEKIEEEKTE